MKSTLKKLIAGILLAVLVLNVIEIPAISQLTQVEAAVSGRVSSESLTIYKSWSTSSAKLAKVAKGKKVTVLTTGNKWVKVSVGGVTGYVKGSKVKTAYGNASYLFADSIAGKTNCPLLVRSGKSDSTKVLSKLKKNAKVQVLTTNSTWVKVKVGNTIGYVKGKYVKTENGTASQNKSKGEALVAYAKRFLGNPYSYGGSSLTNGTDCSGFVMALYKHYGIKLPHSSSALRKVGRAVKGGIKNAKPGDIICYNGHVAIYIGNNKIIHASNKKSGIKITNNASYRKIVAIRRIF